MLLNNPLAPCRLRNIYFLLPKIAHFDKSICSSFYLYNPWVFTLFFFSSSSFFLTLQVIRQHFFIIKLKYLINWWSLLNFWFLLACHHVLLTHHLLKKLIMTKIRSVKAFLCYWSKRSSNWNTSNICRS